MRDLWVFFVVYSEMILGVDYASAGTGIIFSSSSELVIVSL